MTKVVKLTCAHCGKTINNRRRAVWELGANSAREGCYHPECAGAKIGYLSGLVWHLEYALRKKSFAGKCETVKERIVDAFKIILTGTPDRCFF
jgi:hypothetical protein